MIRSWGFIYAGNILGGAILGVLAAGFGIYFGAIEDEALGHIALELVRHQWWIIFVSAVLAGWMMGLLSWLVAATSDTISQIVCIWLVTGAIGFAGLHHCIAGSVEVIAGFFGDPVVTIAQYGNFLLWATSGNIVGGIIFSLVKFMHASQTVDSR